uniref:leucine--tRNA ligase n=1 Tax=Phallusia mammillata TaxID=59560 RepID=A0A6F9DIU6_9ASCI|nr:probable leucine--tRNA ligase, mitochondrial [Phallusia mammillata]
MLAFQCKYQQVCRKCCLPITVTARNIYSETSSWPQKYKKKTRVDIERHWSTKLSERWKKAQETPKKNDKPKFYCLSMFPYPSGKLHMGHVRVYTISDAMAHYHRMNGKEVLHPIGWDSFGLPAENAALTRGLDPAEWTEQNIASMKHQLMDLDLFFDWKREISTCSPEYYKWTQYLFLKLFESGLAYRSKAEVNWDPVDKTVLANEQVDEDGRSWRSGAIVEKKNLEQWFLRITKYSQSLLKSLGELNEDVGVKAMQRHWIGDSSGTYCRFSVKINGKTLTNKIPVYCTHPTYVSHGSHVNLQTSNLPQLANLLEDNTQGDNKTIMQAIAATAPGQPIDGIELVNPFGNENLKLVISNQYCEAHDKALSVLGLPVVNEDDLEIAKRLDFPIKMDKPTLSEDEALAKIKSLGCGEGYLSSSKLADWLISRQRRWGTPIPIVYCPEHGAVAVPEDELPVILPKYHESLDEWEKTTCPKCGSHATRETDTMDTFVDSSWYFFRYTDPHNSSEPFSRELADSLMPVDLYIGGKEHAVLHLYYARFFSHFCADLGMVKHREPFKHLLAQGLIKGKTYRVKSSGKYLHPDDVLEKDGKYLERSSGHEVETSFEKMSKSKLNGVDPGDFLAEWGITITRLFVLYAAAPFESIDWDVKTDVIPGVMRWQMKMWRCVSNLRKSREKGEVITEVDKIRELKLAQHTNNAIAQITTLFDTSCTLSAAITLLMTLAKDTSNCPSSIIASSPHYERSVCAQVIMSAPLMPHFASELWEGLRSMKSKLTDFDWDNHVLDQSWPKPIDLGQQTLHKLFVKVDNKHCTVIHHSNTNDDPEALQKLTLQNNTVLSRIKGRKVTEIQNNGHQIEIHTDCCDVTKSSAS